MSSENATVHVANISHQTTEKEINDFFSFCGKIEKISVTPTTKEANAPLSATITFFQSSAARTALLLDNTQLSGVPIHVSAPASLTDLDAAAHTHDGEEGHLPSQEDKPRTAIVAEYLASGYILGDKVLNSAIEFDEKRGISARFRKFITELDNKHKVSDKTRAMDSSYGVSTKTSQGFNTISRYFDTALSTPTGQKIHKFYLNGAKQAGEIHEEALRLKKLKEGSPAKCTCTTAGPNGECNCAAGACECEGCKKNIAEKAAGDHEQVPPYSEGAGPSVPVSEKVVSWLRITN
ncbi:hypothetical protein ABW20_dc0108130 [Dactylellina cionopaga]|nr:hypothetical protein ABW20_dc0108130 [Dactylellina cionopaga]